MRCNRTIKIITDDEILGAERSEQTVQVVSPPIENFIIKPVCEALGLDSQNQYEQILGDEVLGQLVGEHPLVAADGKTRRIPGHIE